MKKTIATLILLSITATAIASPMSPLNTITNPAAMMMLIGGGMMLLGTFLRMSIK